MLALVFAALLAEQVTVSADRGLAGLWRIQTPQSVAVRGFFRPAEFGEMRDVFCRIGENLSVHCLHGGYPREGTVTLDGDAVHIAWGTAMARFVIDGKRDGDAITGTFTFKFSGISHDAPAPSMSRRIRAGANDEASELRARLPSVPALNGLGAIQHIAFLGPAPQLTGRGDADFYRVYAIEFARGERLCGLPKSPSEPMPCV
ncbi:MAG TPA: hypothetical protein VHM27_14140 [Rhizomicrobium sp.]|nr:hypothetical protein [Rhizomicrobium sp.]